MEVDMGIRVMAVAVILAVGICAIAAVQSPVPRIPRVPVFHAVCISVIQPDGTTRQAGITTVGPWDTRHADLATFQASTRNAIALHGINVSRVNLLGATGRISPDGKPRMVDPPPGEGSCTCTTTIRDSNGRVIGCGGPCGDCESCIVRP